MDFELLKFSKKIDAQLGKMGLFGKVITFSIAIFVIFAPFFISYWMIDMFFPNSTISGNLDIQNILIVILGFLIQGMMYWVFVATPASE